MLPVTTHKECFFYILFLVNQILPLSCVDKVDSYKPFKQRIGIMGFTSPLTA